MKERKKKYFLYYALYLVARIIGEKGKEEDDKNVMKFLISKQLFDQFKKYSNSLTYEEFEKSLRFKKDTFLWRIKMRIISRLQRGVKISEV